MSPNEVPKIRLDREVTNAGLTYRQPPTPKDGNYLFHIMSEKLTRVGKVPQTASQLALIWSATSQVTPPLLTVFTTVTLLIVEAGIVT